MTRPQATPKVKIDSPRVKVTEWRFAPGAEDDSPDAYVAVGGCNGFVLVPKEQLHSYVSGVGLVACPAFLFSAIAFILKLLA